MTTPPDLREEFKAKFGEMAEELFYAEFERNSPRVAKIEEQFFQWLIDRYQPRPQPLTEQQKGMWPETGRK